jgi:signal transduction histidine kinase
LAQHIFSRSSFTHSPPITRLRQYKNGLIALPISVRLTLGFLAAAFIASAVTGVMGVQRMQLLSQQAIFYHALLDQTIDLSDNADDLLLMNSEMHFLLNEADTSQPSTETILTAKGALQTLSQRYDQVLRNYTTHQLLANYPNQSALFSKEKWNALVTQQKSLLDSTLRSWQFYAAAQSRVLNTFDAGDLAQAREVERIQAEPLQSDALSSLHQLMQFHRYLASTAQDAAEADQQNQLSLTIQSSLVVFLSILIIGWAISRTLVPRLRRLQHVTHAIETGNLEARIPIYGRDEIAQVSMSVNTMLETIVADKQIALAYEQQRQLNQMKDQFLINVSHELRTPLTQVFGYLELLSSYAADLDSDTKSMFINNAKEGCQELMHLVTTVLDATSVKSDIKPPTISSISIEQAVNNVLTTFSPQLTQEYDVHLEIPAGCTAMADPAYFRQVMRNLIGNVLKYVPTQTALTVCATQHENTVQISIKDTGPGIPPAEQSLLFQKFIRLQRDLSGNVRGTGLGLYISQRLVESMHGKIWVESAGIPGEGSCFCFTLPANDSDLTFQ